jgi:hypothetical protein
MRIPIIFVFASLCAARAFGQSYLIPWANTGGGGSSVGGRYAVIGTAGQSDAGGPMVSNAEVVIGGFWALVNWDGTVALASFENNNGASVDLDAVAAPETSPGGTLTELGWHTQGEFRLGFNGLASVAYRVEWSEDLITWTDLGSATIVSPGQFEFVDRTATSAQRFYRIRYPHEGSLGDGK